MTRPWQIIDSAATADGTLELRRRGAADFLITLDNQVLMNSSAHRSELALGRLACTGLEGRSSRPRVLLGGLGMGFTLRAVLDALPPGGRVLVAELNPVVVAWCRGPLAELTAAAVQDPRVRVEVADVAAVVRRRARGASPGPFDAVVLDLYQGPHSGTHKVDDPLYGRRAIEATRAALRPGGMFAVWGEDRDAGFEKRLAAAGFSVQCERPGRGGYRHAVYLARVPSCATGTPSSGSSRRRSRSSPR